jgi:hypothetical protein
MRAVAVVLAAVLMATGCTGAVSPTAPTRKACAWHSVNHSGVAECHVGPAATVADAVGPDRIETRIFLDLSTPSQQRAQAQKGSK